MKRLLFLGLWFVAACAGEGRDAGAPAPEPAAPVIRISPQPGSYVTDELMVVVEAASERYALWAAIDEAPDTDRGPHMGRIEVRLVHSGQIEVIVEDPAGHRWPFSYSYTLNERKRIPHCRVETGAALLSGVMAAEAGAVFAPANEIDRLFVSVDGAEREVARDELDASGAVAVSAGPWPATGVHWIECRIKGVQPFSQRAEIVVDADPPAALWTGAAGPFTREDWPFAFGVWANDTLSGLVDVQLCSPRACITPMGLGSGYFDYATAFTEGSRFQGEITAVARDAVGNRTVLAPLSVDLDFAEPPALPLAPLAATHATVISMYDYLPGFAGGVAEVRRVADVAAALSPGALPLLPGWNDFLFRQVGKTEWESFAIYRLGWHAALPPLGGEWLAFASSSTVPAFNGTVRAASSGGEVYAGWWDIPHVYFVNDADGDGAWSEAETACLPSSDSFESAWFMRVVPWSWAAGPGECYAAAVSVPAISAQAWCGDCAMGGRLWIEARPAWQSAPAFRAARTAVSAAALLAGAPVTAPAAGEGVCAVYWDENANGAADGDEPRAFSACGAAEYVLARRGGTLRVSQSGDVLHVGGLRYGGGGWVALEVTAASGAVVRRSLGFVRDADGLGSATIALPSDAPPFWPWVAKVTDAETSAGLALSPPATATPAANLRVWIVDHLAQPLTAPVVFAVSTVGETAGGLFDGAGAFRLLGVQTAGAQWSGMAYREGYLSVAGASANTDVTLKLLPPQVTGRLAGRVLDAAGRPVPGANVTWSAAPYESRTVADSAGRFSLPALGTGGLWADSGDPGQAASTLFIVDVGTTVDTVELRLPGVGVAPAQGLLGDAGYIGVRGAETLVAAPYYYADLTASAWVQYVGTMERRFAFPGYMPAFEDVPAVWMSAPPSAGPVDAEGAVCGDRRQATGQGGSIGIDAPCWHWRVDAGAETYFLGALDGLTAPDTRPRFGRLHVSVPAGMTGFLRLDDLLFDRSLRLRIDGPAAEEAVPTGLYRIILPDGSPALDVLGMPMRVSVSAGAETSVALP